MFFDYMKHLFSLYKKRPFSLSIGLVLWLTYKEENDQIEQNDAGKDDKEGSHKAKRLYKDSEGTRKAVFLLFPIVAVREPL